MAAAVANKANNVSLSNGFSTGSLSWTAGSRGIVTVASARNTTGTNEGHSVTGGGVTWTEVGFVEYGSRRQLSVLVSDGTPSTGALTITAEYAGGSTYQESQWSVEEVTGHDTGTPFGTMQQASTGSGTSLNCPDVGTIDAGDVVYAAGALEDGADSFAWAAGVTGIVYRSGGANVRSLRTGYSSTDDTPGVTWATSGNGAGILALIVNAAAGGVDQDIAAAGALSITGAAALNATGSLAAAGAVSITGVADLDASGTLAAAGAVSITGVADLDARGVLVAAGALSIAGAADLDAIGSLVAAGALSITGVADLSGSDVDIAASGRLSITGAAALTALGQLLAAGSIAITGAATLDDGQVPVPPVADDTFTGGFVYAYERELARRRRERKKRQEREEEAERIEEETSREIARFLHEQEANDARRAELQRLSELVETYARRGTEAALSERVQKAISKAATKQTAWALYALERELKRAQEEESFLLEALRFVIDYD